MISPPPSPPEGWVQFEEDRPNTLQPGLGFELISKLAALNAGESHEIIERTASHPSIVLFTCEVWKIFLKGKIDKNIDMTFPFTLYI